MTHYKAKKVFCYGSVFQHTVRMKKVMSNQKRNVKNVHVKKRLKNGRNVMIKEM